MLGASRPASRPSSVDLPLPDGPTIGHEPAGRNREIERMQNRQRTAAALDRLRHAAQFDHRVVLSRAAARAHRQMVCSMIVAPSAFGWMPSALFSAGNARHALEEERHERHVVLVGQIAEGLPELRRVDRAVVGRRFHAR